MAIWDLVIVGGGPAGLFAAIQAASSGMRILLLEKNRFPGQKLLLTGSGQCNYTNIQALPDLLNGYGNHARFIKPALYFFSNHHCIEFFRQCGIEPELVEKTGKIFPRTRKSQDVLDTLINQCRAHDIQFRFESPVLAINHDSQNFRIDTKETTFTARQILLATGGLSFPDTGSTGDGYAFAQSLGHTVVPPRPGLTSFVIQNHPLADLAGTSFQDLPVTLWQGQKKIKCLINDMVITHVGVSGPVIQNLSRYANAQDRITLGFSGTQNPETLRHDWLDQFQKTGSMNVKKWLAPHLPTQALLRRIMDLLAINPDSTLSQLNRQQRQSIFDSITAFPLMIEQLGGFSMAMVTCGGVCLNEVNPKSMESRLIPGLFFAGEVLDIDGDCGGYDLQAAWSTAALAAQSIKNRFIKNNSAL